MVTDKPGITLYSNGVMIMDKCDKLVSEHFGFVTGVVDSPDLSLNISREILQHDKQLKVIGQNIDKRIKGELEKMMRDNREKYQEFFTNFGVYLKCGVCNDYGRHSNNLKDLLMFYTGEEKQISLKEYLENMPESQKAIYYASSDSIKHAISLPQCEDVRKRGFEIIYLSGPLDEMVVSNIMEYEGKLYFSTANTKEVYKQLIANPAMQIISLKPGTLDWVRIRGKAIKCKDLSIKQRMLDECPVLTKRFTSADCDYFALFAVSDMLSYLNTNNGVEKIN